MAGLTKRTENVYRYFIARALGKTRIEALRLADLSLDDYETVFNETDALSAIAEEVVNRVIKFKMSDALSVIVKSLNSPFPRVALAAAQDLLDRGGIVKKSSSERKEIKVNLSNKEIDRLIQIKEREIERFEKANAL